ncbi:uncharacterized protein LOC62_05G007650 [Vanrija pseudolonga]|uniref:Uncharacterized protein n=1 Tax=Vanrija pseudolonga TaxID=143232 RepID=A0AAF0YHN8_9TREE|nr:hypothetical protein LOC62_05G007650 [Vanrija pseudolonga]
MGSMIDAWDNPTNKDWPADQYWHPWDISPHSYLNWTEEYGLHPGSGYFITIYLMMLVRPVIRD